MIAKLLQAFPTPRLAAFGSLLWSALMALSAAAALWASARTSGPGVLAIAVLFAAGGLTAFAPAITIANLFASHSRQKRFAAIFVSLTIFTIGLTASLYALHFRFYFSQWHADPLTIRWAFEFAFTIAAALYQFAVLGMRLFFPVGLIALFAVSYWYANRSH